MGFGFPHDFDSINKEMKPDAAELAELEKTFGLFASQPKSAPITSLAEHFQLPPFASTAAHALIQRSLSQGNDPNAAVSMLLASNGGESLGGLNFLGQPLNRPSVFSPAKLPILPPERNPSRPGSEVIKEEIEPVSTTTRSRKYSSDSMSLPDNQQHEGKGKCGNDEENDHDQDNDNDGDNEAENEQPSQKMPPSEGEDSSLTESRSMEDFQSDDAQNNGPSGGISRRNLNKRMISSTNLRKQRRPMRRLSTSAIIDHNAYQQR